MLFRSVVEHCGYHIERKCDDHVVYVHNKAVTTLDDHLCLKPGQQVIYLAGGCFWGMERVFQALDGVVETRTGYANGNTPNPSYEDIIRNETGYKACVRVIYDTSIIDIRTILTAYFMCIDPLIHSKEQQIIIFCTLLLNLFNPICSIFRISIITTHFSNTGNSIIRNKVYTPVRLMT